MILLSDALLQMEKCRTTFQLKFVTLNISQKTGGEIIELTNAYRVKKVNKKVADNLINVKQKDSQHHPHLVHIHLITEFNHDKVFI